MFMFNLEFISYLRVKGVIIKVFFDVIKENQSGGGRYFLKLETFFRVEISNRGDGEEPFKGLT